MRSRKFGTAFLIIFATIVLSGLPASAHILRSDNGVNAELHIPPDDRPPAMQPIRLEFSFEDEPAGFSLNDCGCTVQVSGQASATVDAEPQPDPQLPHVADAVVTFPEAGTYTITLSGFTTASHHDRFQMSYPAHVYPAVAKASKTGRIISGIVLVLCAEAAIGVLVYYNRLERKPKQPERRTKPHAKSHK